MMRISAIIVIGLTSGLVSFLILDNLLIHAVQYSSVSVSTATSGGQQLPVVTAAPPNHKRPASTTTTPSSQPNDEGDEIISSSQKCLCLNDPNNDVTPTSTTTSNNNPKNDSIDHYKYLDQFETSFHNKRDEKRIEQSQLIVDDNGYIDIEYGVKQFMVWYEGQDTVHQLVQRMKDTHQYMLQQQAEQSLYHNRESDIAEANSVVGTCRLHNELCVHWAASGECEKNTEYMSTYCAPACFHCEDQLSSLQLRNRPIPNDTSSATYWNS